MDELSAKILIVPDTSAAARNKFSGQLQAIVDKIPESKLPKIKVRIDESKTRSMFQKQLKQIMSELSLDTGSLNSKNPGTSSSLATQKREQNELSSNYKKVMETMIKAREKFARDSLVATRKLKLQDDLDTKRKQQAQINLNNLYKQAMAYQQNTPRLVGTSYGSELQGMIDSLANFSKNKNASVEDVKKIQGQFTELTANVRAAGLETETFGQKIERLFKSHFDTAIAMYGIYLLRQSLSQLIQTVQELDKQLVNLQMSTGGTRKQTVELLSGYNDMAKVLGATTVEVSESATEWLRQGKSIEDTNTLIKNSMILSKVGMLSSSEATQYLTSAMMGYKVAVKDTIGIVDKLSAVDLKSATSAGGLAEAMSRTANSANLAGISMDKLIGYLAVTGEVTQRSMDSIGESYKTMFARMGDIKLGKLEDDDGESLSDTEAMLGRVGIKLRDSSTQFRNFGDVLDEVGSRWNTFNDVEQNSIAKAIAGTRQRENFLVLMTNYNKALDYTSTAANSAGTAQEKFNEAWLGGIESSANSFKAEFEDLSRKVLESGLIKFFIELGTKLLSILNLGDGIIAKITAGIALLVLIPPILKTIGSLALFKNLLVWLPKIIAYIKSIPIAIAIAKAEAAGLSGALSLLNINPVILALTALVAVGYAAVKIYDALTVSEKEAEEAAQAARQKYENTLTEIEKINSELKTTQDRINELNSKEKLTFIEKDELKKQKDINAELKLRNELLQRQKEIEEKEKNNAIVQEYKTKYESISLFGGSDRSSLYKGNFAFLETVNLKESIDEQIRYLNELLSASKLEDINIFSGAKSNIFGDGSNFEKIRVKEIEQIKKVLNEAGVELSGFLKDTTDTDEKTKALRNSWRETAAEINNALSPDKVKAESFSKVFDNDFKYLKQQLIDLAKEGKLDESVIKGYKGLEDILSSTGLTIPEVIAEFEALAKSSDLNANSVADLVSHLDDLTNALSKLVDNYDLLSTAQDEFNETGLLSLSTLEAISNKYPELQGSVTKYIVGLSTSQELISDLSKAYEVDVENYRNSIIAKLSVLPEFYDGLSSSQKQAIDMLGKSYNVDLSNVKTVEEAKAKIRNAYMTQWMKDYDKYVKLSLSEAKTLLHEMQVRNQSGDNKEKNQKIADLKAYINALEGTSKKINTIVFEPLKLDPANFSAKTLDSIKDAAKAAEKAAADALSRLKDAYSNVTSLIDLVIRKIKQQKEAEKDALKAALDAQKKKLDGIKKELDLRREAINQLKNERDYEQDLADKRKAVTDIQAQLTAIANDNSDWANKRRIELAEEMAKKQQDLDDFTFDHSIQKQLDEIDEQERSAQKAYDIEEEKYNKQIELIEKYLNDSYGIYQEALRQVNNASTTLYNDLIAWNRQYGDNLDATVIDKWYAAKDAMLAYGNALKTISAYEESLKTGQAASPSSDSSSPSSPTSTSTNKAMPSVGSSVTVKTTAKKWSNGVGMASFVPGGKYTVMEVGKTSGTVVIGRGGVVTGRLNLTDLQGYAKGTMSAPAGPAIVDEDGKELIIHNSKHGRFQILEDGDGVLPADLTKRIFGLANNPAQFVQNQLGDLVRGISNSSSVVNNNNPNINVSFNISGNADSSTLNLLRKYGNEFANHVFGVMNQGRYKRGINT